MELNTGVTKHILNKVLTVLYLYLFDIIQTAEEEWGPCGFDSSLCFVILWTLKKNTDDRWDQQCIFYSRDLDFVLPYLNIPALPGLVLNKEILCFDAAVQQANIRHANGVNDEPHLTRQNHLTLANTPGFTIRRCSVCSKPPKVTYHIVLCRSRKGNKPEEEEHQQTSKWPHIYGLWYWKS